MTGTLGPRGTLAHPESRATINSPRTAFLALRVEVPIKAVSRTLQ
jgi:hypothetical protein